MATLSLPCFAISGGSSTAIAELVIAPKIEVARENFIMKIAPSDHCCEKRLRTYFTGCTENLGRRAGFHDDAMVHIDDGIGDLTRKAELMGDHHHRHAAAGKFLHD